MSPWRPSNAGQTRWPHCPLPGIPANHPRGVSVPAGSIRAGAFAPEQFTPPGWGRAAASSVNLVKAPASTAAGQDRRGNPPLKGDANVGPGLGTYLHLGHLVHCPAVHGVRRDVPERSLGHGADRLLLPDPVANRGGDSARAAPAVSPRGGHANTGPGLIAGPGAACAQLPSSF